MLSDHNAEASQGRHLEASLGSPHTLTLEVDSDYYEALEGSDFDWQAVARARTGTRVHWAESVISPKQRRNPSSTESWHDKNVIGEDMQEYSSWQISLGIANERAALTSAGQPTIDEFAPWQQRLGLQAVLEEQQELCSSESDSTPLSGRAVAKLHGYAVDRSVACGDLAKLSSLSTQPARLYTDDTMISSRQVLDSRASMPRSPRFSFRRRNSAPTLTGGKKKSILRDRSRHHPRPVASSASFASPRWRSQDTVKSYMRVITNKVDAQQVSS